MMRALNFDFEPLRTRHRARWGEAGEQWVAGLPGVIDRCRQRWDLTPEHRFPSTFNFVCAMRRVDGAHAVLKTCFPGSGEYWSESRALALAGGDDGVVEVLDRWDDEHGLLLDRLMPGSSLRPLVPGRDDEATAIVAGVMASFWAAKPADRHLTDIVGFADDFVEYRRDHGAGGPVPRAHIDRAEALFRELSESMTRRVLLHGDLHHDNVLDADGRWIIIDPKGMIGEPEFEVAAFVRNPPTELAEQPRLRELLHGRVAQLAAALRLDPARAGAWSYCQAVLAGVSAAYGGERVWQEHAVTCANALS
jgi:streptomycin 6-kinase